MVLSLIVGLEFCDVRKGSPDLKAEPDSLMPAPWDKRYLKNGDGVGIEAFVLRTGAQSGWWAMALPDGDVVDVKIGEKKVVRTSPEVGILYGPLPVMSQARRDDIIAMADAKIAAGSLRKWGPAEQSSFRREIKRFTSVLFAWPLVAMRWVRWCLRSRARAGGLLGINYLAYELLSYWGLFDYLGDKISWVYLRWAGPREVRMESSESLIYFVRSVEGAYHTVRAVIEPGKLVMRVGALLMIYFFWRDVHKEDSRVASPISSVEGVGDGGRPSPGPAEAPGGPRPSGTVFCADYGACWHRRRDCGGLRKAKRISEVPESAVEGLRPCRMCAEAPGRAPPRR